MGYNGSYGWLRRERVVEVIEALRSEADNAERGASRHENAKLRFLDLGTAAGYSDAATRLVQLLEDKGEEHEE